MKHGIKLKRKHKEFLTSLQLDPRDYLLERQTPYEYRFINIKTGRAEQFNLRKLPYEKGIEWKKRY